jgi:hypothetical protein
MTDEEVCIMGDFHDFCFPKSVWNHFFLAFLI